MNNFKSMSTIGKTAQKGFTIIELVVVILLLGILTATALPRFLDISTEAHNSVVRSVGGGFRTGVALFRANWFALSQPTTQLADWGYLTPNTSGFPSGLSSSGTSSGVVDSTSDCFDIYNNIMDINAGAPAIVTGVTAASLAVTDDTALHAMTDAALAAAGAGYTQDFVANWEAASKCRYWYIADPQRLAIATTPYLEYDFTTGALTVGNITN